MHTNTIVSLYLQDLHHKLIYLQIQSVTSNTNTLNRQCNKQIQMYCVLYSKEYFPKKYENINQIATTLHKIQTLHTGVKSVLQLDRWQQRQQIKYKKEIITFVFSFYLRKYNYGNNDKNLNFRIIYRIENNLLLLSTHFWFQYSSEENTNNSANIYFA